MTKLKIFLYHLVVFVLGTVGFGIYFWHKISALPAKDGLIGVALLPVMIVYIGSFGILCLMSFIVFLILKHFKKNK